MKVKRLLSIWLVCLLCTIYIADVYAAAAWPSNVSLQSEAGIVMDKKTGAVLFGQNIHNSYYPASITKLLTALIVIENVKNLDETLTFSYNAVYNVESGSSNAGYDEGDVVSIRDALYAMLLKSANEAANALAEYTAGSIEEFAVLMNQKAEELGCTDSNFANPSGLNNENHYTSAYDFALIARAAFSNPTLLEIASTSYYKLPASKNNPEGLAIYTHHGMLRSANANYYEYALAGKTGYTSLAGNTLVTYGIKDDMELITVVLNGKQTHYSDTKAMMEFGFGNFKSLPLNNTEADLNFILQDTILVHDTDTDILYLESGNFITLPKDASISDASMSISYELTGNAPANAVANIEYTYNDRRIGTSYLLKQDNLVISTDSSAETFGTQEAPLSSLGTGVWSILSNTQFQVIALIGSLIAIIIGIFLYRRYQSKRKHEEVLARIRERRLHRQTMSELLGDSPLISEDENYRFRSRSRKKKHFF